MVTIFALVACESNNGKSTITKFGAGMLANCSVNLEENDTSLAVVVKTDETVSTKNKGYLAKFDSKNNLSEVTFLYESRRIEITQDEIAASISNLFVTKKFTYITFVQQDLYTGFGNYTSDASFSCSDTTQSFVIDNETHKLYPTNAIGDFTDIRENFVRIGEKYHELLINGNGNLESRKIVPNDRIHEKNVMVDKFGNVFVENDTLNEIRENFFYHTYSLYRINIGDDRRVYSFSEDPAEVKFFDADFNLQPLEQNIIVRIEGHSLIRDNKIFYEDFYYETIRVDGTTYYAENLYIVGHNIFAIKHDNNNKQIIYLFDTQTLKKGELVTEYTGDRPKIAQNSLFFTINEYDGRKQYRIYADDAGVVKMELVVDITYINDVVTIQPLN